MTRGLPDSAMPQDAVIPAAVPRKTSAKAERPQIARSEINQPGQPGSKARMHFAATALSPRRAAAGAWPRAMIAPVVALALGFGAGPLAAEDSGLLPGRSTPQPALSQSTTDPTASASTPLVPVPMDLPATLVADSITLNGDQTVTATGSVEVWYQGNHLTAPRITYDGKAGQLTIDGPIRLTEPGSAGAVILADQADLSRDLQNGILTGARLVLARELQLAATRITREDGHLTTMERVVTSSCRVCAGSPTPLWEIRARRVTHDTETQQLLFEGAQFRAYGVPLAYIPRLRLPDPTVDRMSGFLAPKVRTTSNLGFGVSVPYFLVISPSADLTLTPYLASKNAQTLGARWRQAFNTGTLEVNGAVSRDQIQEGTSRGYLFADGRFAVPGGFTLGAELRLVSDRAYLVDYDISDEDRLWSGLTLERVRRDELIQARIGNTRSIRDVEDNATQPTLAADFNQVRVFRPDVIGGEATLEWEVHSHRRSSAVDKIGRDATRVSLQTDWRRNWVLPAGVMVSGLAELAVDAYQIRQDRDYPSSVLNVQPTAGVEIRWPWVKSSGRASYVIEPVAQFLVSGGNPDPVPNEESLLVEFDEGNLFSLSRYPGADMRERGTRANLGLSWTRYDAGNWSLGVTVGRAFRTADLGQFGTSTGLRGKSSDWLISTSFANANGLKVSNRMLLNNDISLTREELRLAWVADKYAIGAGYLWMQADPSENRDTATNELLLDTSWSWRENWSGSFTTRYDFTADRAARAGLGLRYANECVSVDLSLSRRFTSSTSVKPDTGIGLSVQLAGFGGARGAGSSRSVCAR